MVILCKAEYCFAENMQALAPCEVTSDNNFLVGTWGYLDGANHGDFLSFSNYLTPRTGTGGQLGVGRKEMNFKMFLTNADRANAKAMFSHWEHCAAFSSGLFNL